MTPSYDPPVWDDNIEEPVEHHSDNCEWLSRKVSWSTIVSRLSEYYQGNPDAFYEDYEKLESERN